MEAFVEIVSSLGFPIACVIALGWFALYMVKRTDENNQRAMTRIEESCKEREDKLYSEIKENRQINGQFAQIISKYDTKLDAIQRDVSDIKVDITTIKAKD